MSHLDYIVSEVKAKGVHEEPYSVLINAYFRGENALDQIKAWANSVGLHVSFSDLRQSCTFRAIGAPSTQAPPSQ